MDQILGKQNKTNKKRKKERKEKKKHPRKNNIIDNYYYLHTKEHT